MKTYISNIGGKWYAFGCNVENGQVYSIGSDNPKFGGRWFSRKTESGIKYVASASPSRAAACAKAKRNGIYCGVM